MQQTFDANSIAQRDRDAEFMRRALDLARLGWGQVAPNPLVGAVVVRDGRIVGEGYHARFGDLHAEPTALAAAGSLARGSTVYVTLEPCNHHGKTPPCTEALRAAGVARVVYAVDDPDPRAAGGGASLARAGVAVTSGVLHAEASELNAPFLYAARGATRPWVTLKLAISVDGAIAYRPREQRWLTGAESRRAVHRLRAGADAIAVGLGTVIADDPELTVRDVPAPRVAPVRVVFDRAAAMSLESRLVRSALETPVWVMADKSTRSNSSNIAALRARGVVVIECSTTDEALTLLHARGIRHLLVEGGAGLASSFATAGHIDRLITFQAPVILGAEGLPAFATWKRDAIAATRHGGRLEVVGREVQGEDLVTVYRFGGEHFS